MLTSSIIAKYGVTNVLSGYSKLDGLFSGEGDDAAMAAENHAGAITNGQYFDITIAICKDYKVETQIIVFKDKTGYDKYIEDGIVIFNNTEV